LQWININTDEGRTKTLFGSSKFPWQANKFHRNLSTIWAAALSYLPALSWQMLK
jgi:hypothetical protein